VATVSIGKGGAKNAAVLAAEILALKFPDIAEQLTAYREKLTREVLEKGQGLEL
jgi:5-(carboxyamino)imidazole ribonucleotide mutase